MSAPEVLVGADDDFSASRRYFEETVSFLHAEESSGLEHGVLEERLEKMSQELFRLLFQDHFDFRAHREERLEGVTDDKGTPRNSVETGHHRALATIFGAVNVERLAYRRRGEQNLHPADAASNLPEEKHSHGLRRWAAIEATRGSFDDAKDAIERATGQSVPKRQVEALVRRAATDVDAFYAERSGVKGDPTDALVISVDGKGIVMRPDALREATKRAAEASAHKLETRLSKGEKGGRKRMAEVGAVYDVTPVPRAATDILATKDHEPVEAPVAKNKWLTASVVEDTAAVITEVFDEAQRRDPEHQRPWVAVVDGNNHQIDRIKAEAAARWIDVTILIDVIHVLEYLWAAAWCFFEQGDPAAEAWVRDRALAILEGGALDVASGIRRRATAEHLKASARKGADTCADYLTNKAPYLDYPLALSAGWPIASGVIEGAVRHLVKDRMDLTGSRWGLDGAEAVLKLRALNSNEDFPAYWRFHQSRELDRVHRSRYADNVLPRAA